MPQHVQTDLHAVTDVLARYSTAVVYRTMVVSSYRRCAIMYTCVTGPTAYTVISYGVRAQRGETFALCLKGSAEFEFKSLKVVKKYRVSENQFKMVKATDPPETLPPPYDPV